MLPLLLATLIACNPDPGEPADTGDTADAGDTGDTADTADTTEPEDTGDTGDTADPGPTGSVSTLAGSGVMDTVDGSGTDAAFREPKVLALGPDGLLYVGGGAEALRVVTMDGEVSTLSFEGPTPGDYGGMAIDASGAVYVSDPDQHCIIRIADGRSEAFAGSCGRAGFADGASSLLSRPRGLSFDADGNLLLADSENMRIRSITPDGVASTIAGVEDFGGPTEGPVSSARLYYPLDVAEAQDGAIYFTGLDNCVRRVSGGQVEDVAGLCQNYSSDGTADGAAASARFHGPYNIAFDAQQRLFVSDSFNSSIRVLSADLSQVSTLTGGMEGYLDGTLEDARFDLTRGIAFDAEGTLFVADSNNNVLRTVVW
jgi:sugar lactone lactonase YvrE